jgi:hypothetical protein
VRAGHAPARCHHVRGHGLRSRRPAAAQRLWFQSPPALPFVVESCLRVKRFPSVPPRLHLPRGITRGTGLHCSRAPTRRHPMRGTGLHSPGRFIRLRSIGSTDEDLTLDLALEDPRLPLGWSRPRCGRGISRLTISSGSVTGRGLSLRASTQISAPVRRAGRWPGTSVKRPV